jgi:methylglutaconyl-CoA hydratase
MGSLFDAELRVATAGAVATVTLCRPEVGNALTRAMMVRLADIFRELGGRPDVHVIVLVGQGEVFCRGRDGSDETREHMSAYELRGHLLTGLLRVFQAIAQTPIPIVACVGGLANNFGVTLAAACDITFAADHATFRYAEIEQGTPPTAAISILAPHLSPKALGYLIYGARQFTAQDALRCGLVTDVFPRASFAQQTTEFVGILAGRPRSVLESIKLFQSKAAYLTPDMRAEYAVAIRALAGTAPG